MERKKSEPISLVQPTVTASQTTTPTGSSQDLTASGAGGGTSRSDRLARKRSKSRSTQGDFRIQLTLDQKLEIITSEHDLAKNECSRREVANEKKLDQLKVCSDSLHVCLILEICFFFFSLTLNGWKMKKSIFN